MSERRIFLFSDLDEEKTMDATKALFEFDDAGVDDPVTLHLSCYGGSVCDMFTLADTISNMGSSVTIHVTGKCMSAAAILVTFGDWRMADAHTRFMIHDVTSGVGDGATASEIISDGRETGHSSDALVAALTENTIMDSGHWRSLFANKNDTFFGAETALEWGMIDEII